MWHFFSTSKIVYVTLIFNFNEHLRPELQVIKYGQMAIRGKSLLYPSNSWLGTKMCELIVKMCVFVIAMLLCKYCWQKDSSDPDFSCGRDEPTEGSTRGPRGPKNNFGPNSYDHFFLDQSKGQRIFFLDLLRREGCQVWGKDLICVMSWDFLL